MLKEVLQLPELHVTTIGSLCRVKGEFDPVATGLGFAENLQNIVLGVHDAEVIILMLKARKQLLTYFSATHFQRTGR